MENIPMNLFDELSDKLKVSTLGLQAYAHGQVKYAASFAVKNFGHEWALSRPVIYEAIELRRLRAKIKKIVYQSADGWHSNKYKVWSDFRGYARECSIPIASERIVSEIKANVINGKSV